jgi:hypothetical protein
MSGSRNKLEQILELLLNEDHKQAEDLLHEYVVSKAREEYERVLDEADDEFGDEDDLDDIEDEIEDNEEDLIEDEDEDEGEFDGEGDVEDRVDDLEAELEDLRAEFEALMSDDDMDGDVDGHVHDDDVDMDDMADEFEVEDEMDMEDLEEATQLSDKVGEQPMKGGKLKGADEDSTQSPYTKSPKHTTVSSQGKPVHAKDGGEGKKDHGGSVKHDATHHNIDVDPAKAGDAKDGASDVDGGSKKSPLS